MMAVARNYLEDPAGLSPSLSTRKKMNFVINLFSSDKPCRQLNLVSHTCARACCDGKKWNVGHTAKGTPRQGFGGSTSVPFLKGSVARFAQKAGYH